MCSILQQELQTIIKFILFFVTSIFVSLSAFAISSTEGDEAYLNKNFEAAFKYYQISADAGDAHSQVMLGKMYLDGKGTARSRDNAFKYFIKSSRQDNEIGKINLAQAYIMGYGTKPDKDRAEEIIKSLGNQEIELYLGTTNKKELLSMLENNTLKSWEFLPYLYKTRSDQGSYIPQENSASSDNNVLTEKRGVDLATSQCKELGFNQKTKQFAKCLSTLQPKITATSKESKKGDGTADDLTCQKYGFKVAEESYKKCRLDLKIAADESNAKLAQYEIQKRAYEQQIRQYEEQKSLYESQLAAAQAQKNREDTWNLLTFGAALINGRSIGDSAYALRGQPVPPRQYYPITPPAQPSIPNFTLSTPRGNAYCSYNSITNQMNCR